MKLKRYSQLQQRLRRGENEEGVTLIELLAVIVILAIIAAIAIPIVLGSITRSKESVTQQNLSTIAEALNRYQTNNGQYPADINTLANSDSTNGNQPYLKAIPQDGWQHNFEYTNGTNSTTFTLQTNVATGSENYVLSSNMAAPTKY